ncbi:hypothetical protein [Arenibaculum pallidiluteum]|uniref:hypothetical protein n=1 Tax=Arenibaculum pallidiluteum TaxID=2812559 RepID=UPI001A9566AA|nr:hypothetical protein [Arenibaculum pallidiluteum]
MAAPEHVWMTYAALAERLGVSVDGARMKAKRAGWLKSNDAEGRARILVPLAQIEHAPGGVRGETFAALGLEQAGPDERFGRGGQAEPGFALSPSAAVAALREALDHERRDRAAERQSHADKLRLLTELVERYMAAAADEAAREREAHGEEIARLRAELEEVRAEASQAVADLQRRAEAAERLARDQSDRLERERAGRDALHREREAEIEEHLQLRAERDRLAAELARARLPWWRRFG